jgi:hypothetical protein
MRLKRLAKPKRWPIETETVGTSSCSSALSNAFREVPDEQELVPIDLPGVGKCADQSFRRVFVGNFNSGQPQ